MKAREFKILSRLFKTVFVIFRQLMKILLVQEIIVTLLKSSKVIKVTLICNLQRQHQLQIQRQKREELLQKNVNLCKERIRLLWLGISINRWFRQVLAGKNLHNVLIYPHQRAWWSIQICHCLGSLLDLWWQAKIKGKSLKESRDSTQKTNKLYTKSKL